MKCLCVVMLVCFLTALSVAQTPGLGTVSNVTPLSSCPAGFPVGAKCTSATISCSGTVDIQITFGLHEVPAPKGTIVLHGGSGGTDASSGLGSTFDQKYTADGYSVVSLAWASPWEDTGLASKSIRTAACRPATALNFILNNRSTHGAKCAQGFSGGSGAWAYALAAYDAGSYLDKVVLEAGPVFSDIALGCQVPNPQKVTVCADGQFGCVPGDTFSDIPTYGGTVVGLMRQVTGIRSCGGATNTTMQSSAVWKTQSIVDGTSKSSFSYPHTSIAGWVCDNGLNNSAAQGDLFYQQFTSASQVDHFQVTPIENCAGAEGVWFGKTPRGEDGLDAIVADTTDPISGCVQHTH
ncbi:MAG TPA: hypothetical protein VFB28_01785 [Terriglobales bacterium]|nr:hypothetical protein [Terriglobales bacterium]